MLSYKNEYVYDWEVESTKNDSYGNTNLGDKRKSVKEFWWLKSENKS